MKTKKRPERAKQKTGINAGRWDSNEKLRLQIYCDPSVTSAGEASCRPEEDPSGLIFLKIIVAKLYEVYKLREK